MTMAEYQSVRVSAGSGGWGPGFVVTPTEDKPVILSVTGGGIHPVAARIAELTGGEAVDGFTTSVPDDQVAAVIINCGGTARIGVYPKKRMHTVDVFAGEPSGPLAQFITPDIFVSAVGVAQIELAEGGADVNAAAPRAMAANALDLTADPKASRVGADRIARAKAAVASNQSGGFINTFSKIATGFGAIVGGIINTLLSSGRQALTLTLQTVLPFMAYVSLLIGFVTYTGLSDLIAQGVTPLASNPLGLILLGFITGLPFLSPILGPGAAIAQVVGVLMGTQIGVGALPVPYALPALFAINGQVGCDFVPVGLALGEAKPETVQVGVPAVLFSRMLTAPLAVVLAYFASFLLV